MAARILIIEDDPNTCELMTYLLGAFGHEISTAQDGVAGLAAARTQSPELILCDVQLPKLDGFGVVRALAADPELTLIPRVAVTSSAMIGDRAKLLAAGFHFYSSKPITPERFVEQIDEFLPAASRVSGKRGE